LPLSSPATSPYQYRAVHLTGLIALPYDVATAKEFGQIRARLEETGAILPVADLQIAATTIYHGLELVNGNLRPYSVFCRNVQTGRPLDVR